MFFRRHHPKEPTFDERIARLRECGFTAEGQPDGRTRVSRSGIAAVVEPASDGTLPKVDKAGLVLSAEVGALVDGGYQKFWRTPSGREAPALAAHLKALHQFEEDLREGLGLESLYNQSLGTTFDFHLYDRVQDRDRAVRPNRPWQHSAGNSGKSGLQ